MEPSRAQVLITLKVSQAAHFLKGYTTRVGSHLSRTYDLSVNEYSELILYDLSRCTT